MNKVVLVGCGYWGKNLVRNFFELGGLYAVCDEKKVVGEFDGRFSGEILWPRTIQNYADPSEWINEGVFTAVLHSYLHEELDCQSNWPRYEVDPQVPWSFGAGYPNKMNQLRKSLTINPNMRIFTACGYYDLVTPFATVEHSFNRLHLPLESNITFGYYEGGHMFYTNPAALKKFKLDLTEFYKRAR